MIKLAEQYKLNSMHTFVKVLVADSLRYVVSSISKKLADLGYFMLTASDESEAVGKTMKYSPDLIIVGERLHDISALQFLESVKENIETNGTKVIYITTNWDNDNEIGPLVSMGVEHFLAKPLDEEKLLSMVQNLTGKRL